MSWQSWWKVSIVLLYTLCLVGAGESPTQEKRLLQVFDDLGIKLENICLQYSSQLDKPVLSSQMDQFASKLGQSLKFTHIKKETRKDGIRYTAIKKLKRNLTIRFNVINDELDHTWVYPYISLQLMGNGKTTLNWIQVRKKLEDVLNSYGLIPHFYYTIQGSREMDSSYPEALIDEILIKLKAKEVEAMRTTKTASISAYSPIISEGLQTKGGWMNIQVATRVNSETKRIMLTLGTPIITIEY
ncbi:YwmB family TATA-box binding protein [Thermoflavimicrobium daqui]|uniref:TATA-box binding protein n=1 Tax=Thermoflavimicrobium daqui TaxID=2137476 RepID=A0A364K5Q4_9BACL|nr:YwmB family TATA-box binding protein [Thermoflavimicrobium daqui]RAL24589.1 hypothetical protein DL897_09795 [Thermoflavimicrobium daqui]